jgi:hypothetical protein
LKQRFKFLGGVIQTCIIRSNTSVIKHGPYVKLLKIRIHAMLLNEIVIQ